MFNDFDNYWKFWLVDGISLEQCTYIHPNKQSDVQLLYHYLLAQENITLLVVHGAVTSIDCRYYTDIDIYIETIKEDCDYIIPRSTLRSNVNVTVNSKSSVDSGIILFDRR